ncbi:MAG TPA: cytochrome P450, partial [Pseudonocardiaceae bacterium]
MANLRSRILAWVGRKYLARTQKKGFNLAKMSFLPDAALMPLRRDGLDPVAELGQKRATEPISKISLPFGFNAWLVTGYEENKKVLANTAGFSNDFTNLVGAAGVTEDQNPGG